MLPDIIAPDLAVLFLGLNPGMQAAALGHHFEGRGNRFWRVLHLAGFTDTQLRPEDDVSILGFACGLTSVVARPTARADQLTSDEFVSAAAALERKVVLYRPHYLAFLGKAAYLSLTRQRDADWGLQDQTLFGAKAWLLPNPSGRNRGFSLDELVSAYRALRTAYV
jgi:TDG/mug DNA glycosylase family protein